MASIIRSIRALSRRALIAAACAAMLVPVGLSAAKAQESSGAVAQRIADHFASIQAMYGDFVQFDPNGRQQEGKFYIERPGKVRFDYANSPLRVIADGSNVAINNKKLNTWETYPLSQTPMKLLLSRRIDLSQANIQSVKVDPDLVTIVMGDRSIFGNSRITMMFDAKTDDLKQWIIRDKQGKDTSVMIYNVKTGGNIQDSAFKIPYTAISQGQTGNR
ncbi:outer membrane lipoprotein carrier protein LolA [Jiella sp. MQZ9-1]|uniref:Outer membrane lipoprotein carrier protein LolA n=1 Tax=Jiella flava TaxID=2816857 RepID=A0A939JV90_9HYPH|nr:outer-membrane lipoprotein carrier protein LolA [Jiella flava]MBO0662194.1 outer membrane lipoprotein carrier protein LolA [Jiella flava]MCD2470976.1 outer membrane lipoprotein carrier protein LolA [Jiella flava]